MLCAPHNEHGRVEEDDPTRELLLFEDKCELSSKGVFTCKGLGETGNKKRPLSEAAREHMFASLCRNRSGRTLLLFLPTHSVEK